MLEWLKMILGDSYNEDVDKKVSAEIGKNFVTKTDFNAVNEEKKTLTEQVAERDKQISGLKDKGGDAEALKAEIERLQGENKAAKEKYDSEMKDFRKNALIDAELTKAGAVNVKAVKALLDLSKVDVDGEGKLTGFSDVLKPVQDAEKWAFPNAGSAGDGADDGAGAGAASTGLPQGGASEKLTGVEAEFYKRFPDLSPKDGE